MLEIDKWALNKLEVLKRNVTESYDKYNSIIYSKEYITLQQ